MERSRIKLPDDSGYYSSQVKCKLYYIYIYIYKKVGVLPIRIVWSNVSSIGPSSERNRK